jgi:hypothetical protein
LTKRKEAFMQKFEKVKTNQDRNEKEDFHKKKELFKKSIAIIDKSKDGKGSNDFKNLSE